MFKVGDKTQAWLSSAAYKIHIVAIVDKSQIVFKWYGKHKQWWHYEVRHKDDLKWRVELAVERRKEGRDFTPQ